MTELLVKKSSVSRPPPPLSAGVVHLWLCRATNHLAEARRQQYISLLSAQENAYCERIRDSGQRQCALLTRVLVRAVLSRYSPTQPRQWRFATDEHNKPCVDDSSSSLSFNLSHSGDWIVCAVRSDGELGVDVERCGQGRKLLRLAERFFSKREFEDLQSLTGSQRLDRFYDYWTLKEAWLKATGRGISGGLDQIVFDLYSNGELDYQQLDDYPAMDFRTWQLDLDYRLSLCCTAAAKQPLSVAIYGLEPLVESWVLSPELRYSNRISNTSCPL